MYRAELRTLKGAIAAAIAKATDPETKAHLEASRDEIDRILDPKSCRRLRQRGLPPADGAAYSSASVSRNRGAVRKGRPFFMPGPNGGGSPVRSTREPVRASAFCRSPRLI